MIVAVRFLLDRSRAMVWWAIGVVGLVAFTVAFYPSIRGQRSFDEILQRLPAALRSLIGTQQAVSFTSAPGYMQGRLYSTLLPLLLLIFGIGLGARAIGGSEDEGTLEILLANPVSRRRVFVERLLATLMLLGGLVVVSAVAIFVLAPPFGALEGISAQKVVGASVSVFALALLHTTLAFAVGSVVGRRAPALAMATAIAVGGYLLQGVIAVSEPARPLRFASTWHWYLSQNLLTSGLQAEWIVVFLILSAAMAVVGGWVFLRRDLR